jgi:hypothetical protein
MRTGSIVVKLQMEQGVGDGNGCVTARGRHEHH